MRCTKGQLLEAALATTLGIRSRLRIAQNANAFCMREAMEIAARMRELRELTKMVHQRGDMERTRQLVHIRHMLHAQLLALAGRHDIDDTVLK